MASEQERRDKSRIPLVPAKRTEQTSDKFPKIGPFWQTFDRSSLASQNARNAVTKTKATTPQQVTNPRCTVTAVTVGGKLYSQQDVRFTQPSDPNFAGAYIWIKGYNRGTSSLSATLPWDKVADIHRSPSSFLLDRTTENVIIRVQAYNSDGLGADFDKAPTITTTLI